MKKVNKTWHLNISNKNREEIIISAKELFLKNNFYNVKITDICNLAGVSRVTFYKYFNTMDELIFEVQINILNNMAQFIEDKSSLAVSGKESVKTVLYAWIDFAKEHREEIKFIVSFDLYYSSYDSNEELKSEYRNFTIEDYNRSLLKSALDQGIRDGSLKCEDPLITGTCIFQTVMGLLQRMTYTTFDIECENIKYEEIAKKAVDMIISSIENTDY